MPICLALRSLLLGSPPSNVLTVPRFICLILDTSFGHNVCRGLQPHAALHEAADAALERLLCGAGSEAGGRDGAAQALQALVSHLSQAASQVRHVSHGANQVGHLSHGANKVSHLLLCSGLVASFREDLPQAAGCRLQ